VKLRVVAILAAGLAALVVGAPVLAQPLPSAKGLPPVVHAGGPLVVQPQPPGQYPVVPAGIRSAYIASPVAGSALVAQPTEARAGGAPAAKPAEPVCGSCNSCCQCSKCGDCCKCNACQECGCSDCCKDCCGCRRGGAMMAALADSGLLTGWRVRADGFMLHRSEARNIVFSTVAGTVTLATDSLDFEYEWNIRAALERRVNEYDSVELLYWGFHNWTDSASAVAAGTLLLSPYAAAGAAVAGYDGALFHRVAYSTDVNNAEINYWRPMGEVLSVQLGLTGGLRFIHIDEGFTYTGITATHTGETNIETNNEIFGPQGGFMMNFPITCNFAVRWEGKLGYFINLSEQITRIQVANRAGNALTTDFVEIVRHDGGCFMAEMGVTGTYTISCNLACYAGYYLMGLDGVTLALEQFNPVFPVGNTRPAIIDDDANPVYQGFAFGVEVTW
jgi:hypothetical protein